MFLCLNKLSLCLYGRTQWNCNVASLKLLLLGNALPALLYTPTRDRSAIESITRAYCLMNKGACIVPY